MIFDIKSNCKITPFVKQLNQDEIVRLNIDKKNGWQLPWKDEPFYNDCIVYGLFANPMSNQAQGLVAFIPHVGSLEMFQLESASHNRYPVSNRVYKGVGKYLTAFGCNLSKEMSGTEGFLRACAKPNARGFYQDINAIEIESDLWLIEPSVGDQLIKDYLLGGGV
ncbi:hypothetical protein COE52_22435 [Bacillus thuringiensis]|uniref:hypothetical protein n=1 Tax=Bacillus thuringiensis TaxID=1428 RepID=UPI000BFCE805|nr:hypothetical protein [Bacillus thuringiensis]MCU5358903.1 hypothetical protein [Bacillus cereus]PGZ37468.1 hypothetical protein COE52_22435 [Bacillus thuringiensis]